MMLRAQTVTAMLSKYMKRHTLSIFFLSLWLQVLQISNGYRELETKYEALASLVNNQSQLMTQLEKKCQISIATKPQQVRGFSVYCTVMHQLDICCTVCHTSLESDRLSGTGRAVQQCTE